MLHPPAYLKHTLESVGGHDAGDGAGEEGEERRQHQSRHPATLSANIRQVILSLQLQIINRHPPPRDLAFSLKSYSEYFIQGINNLTIKCFVNVYVILLQHYWLDNITADGAHIHFGAVSRCIEEKHQLHSGSFGYINIEHDTA